MDIKNNEDSESNELTVVACLGETFVSYNDKFYSMPSNASFLQAAYGAENVKIISPSISVSNVEVNIENMSSCVDQSKFYSAPVPAPCSTKDFYKTSIINPFFYIRFIKFCDKVIKENPEAVFWARTPSPISIIFSFRVLKAKRKLMHHICGDARHTWKDQKYKGFDKVLAFLFSHVVKSQTLVICKNKNSTNLTSGSLLYDFSRKVSPSSTFLFVDMMIDSNSISNYSNNRRLLFIGRIVKDKGIFELLDALAKRYEYSLVVVGDGPDLSEAISYAKYLNVIDRVEFVGLKKHEEIETFILNCHAVLMLSKTNEGFPRVIMESWYFNKPVISSEVGGVSAYVKHKVNSYVVRPGSMSDIVDALDYINVESQYAELVSGATKMSSISGKKHWINVVRELSK